MNGCGVGCCPSLPHRGNKLVDEDEFWDKIEQLKSAGAQGILVIPIEKMVI